MPGKIKTAAILLSRQNLRPALKDEWVQNLKKATKFVKSEGWTLCSSVETPNWEIITAGAVIEKVSLNIFLPVSNAIAFDESVSKVKSEFDLKRHSTQFFPASPEKKESSKEELWRNRDEAVIDAADVLIPISVRQNGHIAELLEKGNAAGKEIITEFQGKYNNLSHKLAYTIDELNISDGLKQIGRQFIFHWTRSSNGPWPYEKKLDYYKSVVSSLEYPRNALNTLQRIISTKQIFASSKNMPGKVPTVSFSGLAPTETIKLMRWRSRYRQMSIEPYGIGVEKNLALSMGIKEVQYYDANSGGIPKSVPAWLTQSSGRITDWRNEKEYRHKGDFDLSAAANDNLVAICYRPAEAEELEKRLSIRSVSFCD